MEERMGRIEQIPTDFFGFLLEIRALYTQRKEVLGYNGKTDGADWADGNGFFRAFA